MKLSCFVLNYNQTETVENKNLLKYIIISIKFKFHFSPNRAKFKLTEESVNYNFVL